MPDQKPPRRAGRERDTLMALLQYQRESLVRKVVDLDEDDARRELVASGTTLGWLVKHLTRAEVVWMQFRFDGADITIPDDPLTPDDTVASIVETYRATWAATDAVVAAAALDQLDDPVHRLDGEAPVDLRWVLMHLLEETARHAGHADILRELIDGSTGR